MTVDKSVFWGKKKISRDLKLNFNQFFNIKDQIDDRGGSKNCHEVT